jgi:ATP-binding cassette subfamily B protein
MTSSSESRPVRDGLPPALSSMWRLCRLGYQHEPALIVAAFTLALLAALPDALLAYWFKLLGEGALDRDWSIVRAAALAVAVSATATWFLLTISTRVRQGHDRAGVARGNAAGLDSHYRAPGAA